MKFSRLTLFPFSLLHLPQPFFDFRGETSVAGHSGAQRVCASSRRMPF